MINSLFFFSFIQLSYVGPVDIAKLIKCNISFLTVCIWKNIPPTLSVFYGISPSLYLSLSTLVTGSDRESKVVRGVTVWADAGLPVWRPPARHPSQPPRQPPVGPTNATHTGSSWESRSHTELRSYKTTRKRLIFQPCCWYSKIAVINVHSILKTK